MGDFINKFRDTEVTGYSPDAQGDYYKITDAQIDFNYWQDRFAKVIKNLNSDPTIDCIILYGGVVTDSGGGQVDISAGAALGKDSDGNIRLVNIPALTNIDLPSGWKDNRQVWVVLKYDYIQSSETRNHKITGESYHYVISDSYLGSSDTDDLFVDSDPNSVADTDVCLGSFQMSAVDVFTDLSSTERSPVHSHEAGVQKGMIAPFPVSTLPDGWLHCDGSAISRTTYWELFAVISTTYGIGDGSTTFNLPDYQGIFLRGSGTHGTLLMADGNPYSGPAVGSSELDQGQGHYHSLATTNTAAGSNSTRVTPGDNNGPIASTAIGSPITDGVNGTPRTGDETRPVAYGVKYMIKY